MRDSSASKTRQSYEFEGSKGSGTLSRVTVLVGDLLSSQADVLVSSDDNLLTAGGGVSMALARAGGARLRAAMDHKRGAAVGTVTCTDAGDLHALHVFHAITRRIGSGSVPESAERAREIIRSLTRQCLQMLQAMQLRSIAFPALGTGFAGFSAPDVAAVMAAEIGTWLRRLDYPPGVSIEIYLHEDDLAKGVHTFWVEFEAATKFREDRAADHVVFLIHGIRTRGNWQENMQRILREQKQKLIAADRPPFDARIPKYGFFDALRFLLPIRRFRDGPIEAIRKELAHYADRPEKQVSVVAHSFGTYVISEILKRDPELKLKHIILCGAIVEPAYDWQTIMSEGRAEPYPDPDLPDRVVINDCGERDIWPVLAAAVTTGYGASGRFGFNQGVVVNRFHDFGHSGFFRSARFAADYWVSALTDGVIRPSERDRPVEPLWINYLPAAVRIAAVAAVVSLAVSLLR